MVDTTKLDPTLAATVERIEGEYPVLMRVAEAAEIFRVSTPTIRTWLERGILRGTRVTERKTLVYRDSIIERIIDSQISS